MWSNWACPWHCSKFYAFTLTQTFVYAWWMVGAIVALLKVSTSGLGEFINFLVVGDAKYSAKIEMIGAALIEEGIWCDRARQST